MNDTRLLFVIAQGSLAIALMLKHLLANTMVVLFLIGLFTSLSIVFNIILLVKKGKEIRSKSRNKYNDKFMAR